jgi:hypothetical protein
MVAEAVKDVSDDGVGFEQAKSVMLESGDPAERMPLGKICGYAFFRENVDLHQIVGNTDLRQHQARNAHIDAIGSAEKRDAIHGSISRTHSLEQFYRPARKGQTP